MMRRALMVSFGVWLAGCGGGGDIGDPPLDPDAGVAVEAAPPGIPVFTRVPTTATGTGTLGITAISGSSATSVWTVTQFAALTYPQIGRFDGTAWARHGSGANFYGLNGVYASGPADVWVVGGGQSTRARSHWDGTAWTADDGFDAAYTSVDGLSPSQVWAASSDGDIDAFDGTTWTTTLTVGGAYWTDVEAVAPDAVFAVSIGGSVRRWTGAAWQPLPNLPAGNWRALWATAPDDLYAAGDGIAHFDGIAWTPVDVGVPGAALWGIHGTGPDDLWAVGFAGLVLHFDGQAWRTALTDTTSNLYAVWASSPTDVHVVGEFGTMLHHDGTLAQP